MLNLAEYRKRPALLADYLPWACLVAPGIILNKDGSFQRSARFRGPDLESATEAELVTAPNPFFIRENCQAPSGAPFSTGIQTAQRYIIIDTV